METTYGYIRVSSQDQNEDRQLDVLYVHCGNCVFIMELLCVHLYHEKGLTIKGLEKEGKT